MERKLKLKKKDFEKECFAFAAWDGNKLMTFTQASGKFFMNYGTRIVVSPMNLVVQARLFLDSEVKKKIENEDIKDATVEFDLGGGGSLSVDLRFDPKELIQKFVHNFFAMAGKREGIKIEGRPGLGLVMVMKEERKLFGWPSFRPSILIVEAKNILKFSKHKQKKSGVFVQEIVIPPETRLQAVPPSTLLKDVNKKHKKYYTTWNGIRIPIDTYEVLLKRRGAANGAKIFSEVITDYARRIGTFKISFQKSS